MPKYEFDQGDEDIDCPNGAVLFYTPPDDVIGYDIAVSASNGTLLFEGDVAGMLVYLVENSAHPAIPETQEVPKSISSMLQELEYNLLADCTGQHRDLTTAEYLDDLVDGDGQDVVIVIDRAEEFFTKDGFHTMDRAAEWATANGALIVAVERYAVISRLIH